MITFCKYIWIYILYTNKSNFCIALSSAMLLTWNRVSSGFTKLQHVFLCISLQSHYRVTDEAFLAETSKYGPSSFLQMCSLLLKEHIVVFLFAFTAAGVVPCGGRKTSPRTSTIVQFIFQFWSFEISEYILRNQNLIIGLDSYSRQRLIYLYPILIYISLWIEFLFEIHKIAACFPLHFVAKSLQGHWWGFFSRNFEVWPIFFLTNVFTALEGTHRCIFIYRCWHSTIQTDNYPSEICCSLMIAICNPPIRIEIDNDGRNNTNIKLLTLRFY